MAANSSFMANLYIILYISYIFSYPGYSWIGMYSVIQHLSCLTSSALVWHTHRRVFEPRLLQQVLRFVGVFTPAIRGAQGVLPMRWGV